MKKTNSPRYPFSLSVMIFALVTVMWINFNTSRWNLEKWIIVHDITHYYAYLPAIFIYNDIRLTFLHEDRTLLGNDFYPNVTPTGEKAIITSSGMSMLYFPFFMGAHWYAQNSDYPADGLSPPYKFALQMSSWVFLLIGLFFLRKLLSKYFDDKTTALTLLATVFGSNLLWYVTGEAAMAHNYSFALITVYLFILDKWVERISFGRTIFMGLLIGLISLIRPTNIIIVLLLVLWKITTVNELKSRVFILIQNWRHILLMMAMFFLMWTPQFIYWKTVAGSFLYFSYPDDQGFFFSNPQLFNNLFSWRKGWLIYTPVMGFSIIGMALLYRVRKQFFWPALIYFLFSWYIISSWWDWWYGGGFSIRPYIDSYGIFAFGMAGFLTWAFQQKMALKIAAILLFFLAGFVGLHNNIRYHYKSIHYDSNTRETYFHDFFNFKPSEGLDETYRAPDYELARKGIYRYADENNERK